MKNILFVCTGNICRSAMAHGILQKRLYDIRKENEILVFSCGTYALDNEKATNNSIKAVSKYGVDLKKHRSTSLESTNIDEMDIILCMTNSHKKAMIDLYPNSKDKVFLLKEYVEIKNENLEIPDPWGYDMKVYNDCADDIYKCIELLLSKI